MKNDYTNLVFEGGGVKGIAYAGALETLDERGILCNIKKVAGTSAGAISATLVSLGITAEEIKQEIFSMDFKLFKDGWDPLRIATKYGLYDGDAFLSWIKTMIAKKATAGANATFLDLHNQGMIDLYVYATDLNEFNVKQFSFTDTPNVVVAEAVRASMSIPMFFKAWEFSNGMPDNHVYVDGGVALNYPLTVFDSVTMPEDPQTLGLYFYDYDNCKKPNQLQYDDPIEYAKTLFETLLQAQTIDFGIAPSLEDRIIKINDFRIMATDFDITDEQKTKLYESGKNYTAMYLSQQALKNNN